MNHFTKLAGLGLVATLFLSSCEKDEDRAVLNVGAAPQLTASSTSATLTRTNAASNAVVYTWTPVEFGYQAAITYVLQFAKQGSNFTNAHEVNVGNALTKTFTVEQLNEIYSAVDCNSAGVLTNMDVRVVARVGAAVEAPTSTASAMRATPYQAQVAPADKWGVIGSATPGGWDNDTDMTYDFCSRTFKVTLPLTANALKFRANDAWALNYGDNGNDKKLEEGGADIVITTAGMYELTLNLNTNPATYTITKK